MYQDSDWALYRQCNDGLDNDGDGVIDLNDSDCISPCDGWEGALPEDENGSPYWKARAIEFC